MTTFPRRAHRGLALLWLVGTPALAQEEPGTRDEGAIRAVVEGFHAALAAGDSTAAIGFLHPDAIVYESGYGETLDEYRRDHLASDIEFSRAVSFETVQDVIAPGSDLTLYLRQYKVSGTFRDRPIDTTGVETMVLAPTPAGWKIRHIHWSSR